MNNYRLYSKITLGGSDAARLRCIVHNDGAETEGFINFGEDGRYQAYIVDKDAMIPDAYKCVLKVSINNPATDGLTVYNDDAQEAISFLCQTNQIPFWAYEISGLCQINIYRCGMRGCIIQLMTTGK